MDPLDLLRSPDTTRECLDDSAPTELDWLQIATRAFADLADEPDLYSANDGTPFVLTPT